MSNRFKATLKSNTQGQIYGMGQDDYIKDFKRSELIFDKSFYNAIFKRSEKLVSAVFFILDNNNDVSDTKNDVLINKTKDNLTDILSAATALLLSEKDRIGRELLGFSAKLLLLDGQLSSLVASRRVQASFSSLLKLELEVLLKECAVFNESVSELRLPDTGSKKQHYTIRTEREARKAPRQSSELGGVDNRTPVIKDDRKSRIRDVIRQKGRVGIKDLSEVIKDVSEKSIQRDLISMIRDNEVVREGERRWSVYYLKTQ